MQTPKVPSCFHPNPIFELCLKDHITLKIWKSDKQTEFLKISNKEKHNLYNN